MDARVQDWVVTPRRGKPIEINALWYNALCLTADWCERAARPAGRYRAMAAQVFESAQLRYWYQEGGHCYDVVDGPDGDDASLRPNQVIAFSLIYPLIDGDRARQALDLVSARLLTPYGLRTLSRDDPRVPRILLRGGPLSAGRPTCAAPAIMRGRRGILPSSQHVTAM